MTIRHHLDDATLLAFAAGTLPPELSLVAAAHLDACPRCRRELALLETLGAAMLEDLPAAELSRDAPAPGAHEVEAQGQRRALPPSAAPAIPGLPRTIAGLLPAAYEALPWRRLGRGLWRYDLTVPGAARERGGGSVYLLKASRGTTIPEHSHAGGELTLVLEGAFSDSTGRYAVGDIADLDDHNAHTPVACPDAGCICIVGEEGPPAFRSIGARVVQRLRPA